MITPNDDTQNYFFSRLQIVVETFEHSTLWSNQSKFTKVPKVGKPTKKKSLLIKLWGTSEINSPLSHLSLHFRELQNSIKQESRKKINNCMSPTPQNVDFVTIFNWVFEYHEEVKKISPSFSFSSPSSPSFSLPSPKLLLKC